VPLQKVPGAAILRLCDVGCPSVAQRLLDDRPYCFECPAWLNCVQPDGRAADGEPPQGLANAQRLYH
jgi:hypothetical protein